MRLYTRREVCEGERTIAIGGSNGGWNTALQLSMVGVVADETNEGMTETPAADPAAGSAEGTADSAGEAMVLAMPRRELFTVSGFVTNVEMRVIESVADESWYAQPSVVAEDIEAKEVRLGMLIQRADEVLIDGAGILLHATPIPPETAELADGLRGLRELARLAAAHLLPERPQGIQLIGYFNDDTLPEVRPYFLLVYTVRAADGCEAPEGMVWVPKSQVLDQPLDPVSMLLAAEWLSG